MLIPLLQNVSMLLAIVAFFFLPWLDRSPVRSIRYKGWIAKVALAVFVISFVGLGFMGMRPPEGLYVVIGRIFTGLYFLFWAGMWWWSRWDTPKPVPERVVYHAH